MSPWTGKGWLDLFPLYKLLSPAAPKGSYFLQAPCEQALPSFQHWQQQWQLLNVRNEFSRGMQGTGLRAACACLAHLCPAVSSYMLPYSQIVVSYVWQWTCFRASPISFIPVAITAFRFCRVLLCRKFPEGRTIALQIHLSASSSFTVCAYTYMCVCVYTHVDVYTYI